MDSWGTNNAVGVDIERPAKNTSENVENNGQLFNMGHYKINTNTMSEDIFQTPRYHSWRKLHLSRAKLKGSSRTSAILSGFAMVAMATLHLQGNNGIPGEVLVTFVVITTLLVAVHLLALMISTCILPYIDTVCSLDSISSVDESPHELFYWYIEIAWGFSTFLGLILFLFETVVICWIKFHDLDTTAAWSACVLLVPILFAFVSFALHFYRSLYQYELSMTELKKVLAGNL